MTASFTAVEDESKVGYYYFSPAPQTYVYPSPFWNDFHQKQFTEEARATATVGPVRGLIGGYFSHANAPAYFYEPILPGYKHRRLELRSETPNSIPRTPVTVRKTWRDSANSTSVSRTHCC